MMVQRFSSPLFFGLLCGSVLSLSAQTPGASTNPASTATEISSQVQPTLDLLLQGVSQVRLEKWKTSSSLRDDTDANLSSIRRDLTTPLPQLLATADGGPASVAAVLPLARNLDALYDVLLRVVERAKAFAPQQQSAPLEHALKNLEDSRRAVYDRLQTDAEDQDKQVKDLKAALNARPAPPPPPAPAPVVAPAKPKPKAKAKPAAKPAPKPAPSA
jgi:hypothetical protein